MKIGYFLYDEGYSGVIDSQALDVVRFYNERTQHNAQLIAALPFRTHRRTLAKFKESISGKIYSMVAVPQRLQPVLFMVEAARLSALIKKSNIDILICRNAIASFIALAAKACHSSKEFPIICYDGRGALMAEASEFDIYPQYLKQFLLRAETAAVLNSDFRIAVTEELVQWWRNEYGYTGNRHAIIPTTLPTRAEHFDPRPSKPIWRERFCFTSDDVVLAFAGGMADWQGLSYWLPKMEEWLAQMPKLKLLLLTKPHPEIKRLTELFPSRIINTFVPHEEVLDALSAADYGIMWREANTTNKVASPTKLSEYLQAGLTIISNNGIAVGRIVTENNLGHCLNPTYKEEYKQILKHPEQRTTKINVTKETYYVPLVKEITKSFQIEGNVQLPSGPYTR